MNTASPRSLGATIKRRRQELGWSQEDFAARVASRGDWAFRQSDVSRLERGKVLLPHRERLTQIAAVLELPLGELLAQSGWAGADSLFPAGPAATATLVLPPHGAEVPEITPEPRVRPIEESAGWREVMAQARATLAESQAIVARCKAIEPPHRPAPSPHSSSQHLSPAKVSAATTESA
jgi:transcriptional regulator with XRE-family HTH domain